METKEAVNALAALAQETRLSVFRLLVVWQESIASEYTATPGDAFAAVKRLRLATEGAAKNNIAEGLSRISKLSL